MTNQMTQETNETNNAAAQDESKAIAVEAMRLFGNVRKAEKDLLNHVESIGVLPNISRDIDSAIPVHVGQVPTPTMNLTPEVEEALQQLRQQSVVGSFSLGGRRVSLILNYVDAERLYHRQCQALVDANWTIEYSHVGAKVNSVPRDTTFEEQTNKRLTAIEREFEALDKHFSIKSNAIDTEIMGLRDKVARCEKVSREITFEVNKQTTAMAEACAESIAKCQAEVVSPSKVLWQLFCNMIGWALVIFCWLSGALGAWHIYVWLLNYLSR